VAHHAETLSRSWGLLPKDRVDLQSGLESIRPHQREFRSGVSGSEDVEAARRLSGATFVESRVDDPKLAWTQYRDADLRGMSVVDARRIRSGTPNVDLAVNVDVGAVQAYVQRVLGHTA